MPSPRPTWSRTITRLSAGMVAVALAVTLVVAGCGDDEPSSEAEGAAQANAETSETSPTETTAQPPPESAGDAGSQASKERQETIADDAATGPQSCPDVVVTPNTDNGLFAVEAEGITCEDASAALLAWGESGYPGEGPAGFACEEVSEGRLSCEQDASGGVVTFDTGG